MTSTTKMKSVERQKLLEAIAYFLGNTKRVGLVKLFKLLYYLDMLHFRETGRSVTGLLYKALPYGPVPTDLYRELGKMPADMAGLLTVTSLPADDSAIDSPPARTSIKLRHEIGTQHLTKRELRIASELAEIFRDATADDISDVSHARNGPWDIAKKSAAGKWGVPISYFDSVNLTFGSGEAKSREELMERAAEHDEFRKHFA